VALIKSISGIRGTIGGTIGEALTPEDVVKYASAFGQWVKTQAPQKDTTIVVGRDARVSGMVISKLVCATLQSLGINIIDLGLSTTPTVEMAVPLEGANGGIIITASHNPGNWNALKLLNGDGEFISDDDGQQVLDIANKGQTKYVEVGKLGKYQENNTYIDKHIQEILKLPLVDANSIKRRGFKVAVDCVNSSGGIVVPKLLKALGVEEVKELYCEPNGHFPHNPEPLPEHLGAISAEMEKVNYDLGIVVDPDVDRLAFLCEDGTPFGEEYTLVAVAEYVLKNKPGNTVSNLSSTRALKDITLKAGGHYEASAVGEVNVVQKMKETDAVIGGEGNGGIIFPELHYGRDALVGIALFLSHLAQFEKSTSRLRATYPNYFISKNKIELTQDINVDNVLGEMQKKYKNQPINTVDGVKIEFNKEWVHLRKSNTEPIIRIYSESESLATAEHLANKIISDIKEIISVKAED